ncbi:MAG: MarR family winged helix-turn-helix transcriptional regulator [Gammaproteobacteria bacterium]
MTAVRKSRAASRGGTPRQQRELKLGFLIHDTARLRRLAHDAVLRPNGFTTAQASLMRHLAHEDGQTQSALAEALELGKVALGETVDRLEAAGYVQRRADAADRRAKRVYLTAAGRAALDGLLGLAVRLNADIYDGLDAAELDAATRVLDTVKRNLLRMTRG